ncbi:MAG: ANTAR domain-containing protein [Turicibacter sp.]|nr:ANTAR domain-containing protein [Turicibacter sp.]
MSKVLIASKSAKLLAGLKPHIQSAGFEIAAVTDNQYELSRLIRAWSPQIVIIDEEVTTIGVSFIESLVFDQQTVLLIGKAHKRGYFQPSPYLEFCDKPVQPSVLLMTLRMLSKYAQTVRQLESKITKLEEQHKNEKLIGQAKRSLQQNRGLSEEEAHQYLQKRSMELRIGKVELAKRILQLFSKKA